MQTALQATRTAACDCRRQRKPPRLRTVSCRAYARDRIGIPSLESNITHFMRASTSKPAGTIVFPGKNGISCDMYRFAVQVLPADSTDACKCLRRGKEPAEADVIPGKRMVRVSGLNPLPFSAHDRHIQARNPPCSRTGVRPRVREHHRRTRRQPPCHRHLPARRSRQNPPRPVSDGDRFRVCRRPLRPGRGRKSGYYVSHSYSEPFPVGLKRRLLRKGAVNPHPRPGWVSIRVFSRRAPHPGTSREVRFCRVSCRTRNTPGRPCRRHT